MYDEYIETIKMEAFAADLRRVADAVIAGDGTGWGREPWPAWRHPTGTNA